MKMPHFMGGSFEHRSLALAANRAINVYPETVETGEGKEPGAMVAVPGLEAWQDTGTGHPIRGLYAGSNGGLYIASRTKVFVSFGGPPVELTTVQPISNADTPVNMVDNGQEMVLVDGDKGYRHDFGSGTFTRITDADFPNGSTHVDFLIGYFIAFKPSTQTFYISAQYDGTTWDTLDFTSAEQSPDSIKAFKVVHSEIVVMGNRSTEFYYISTDPDFPFQRNPSAFQEFGIEAPHSLVKIGGTLIWLAENADGDDMILAMRGYQANRISTHMIERRINENVAHENARAWAYEREGHLFYVLQLPNDPFALVYDFNTQRWHERAGWENGQWIDYPALCHAGFKSENLVGGPDGVVYRIDESVQTYGSGIRRVFRQWRPDYGEGYRVFHSQLRLDMETGVGLVVGQGSDPQVMMQYSDDGGNTWSAELWRSAGKIGEYRRRVQWNQLGSAHDRVYRVVMTDPVRTTFTGAYAEMKVAR